ncbi:MULTISPECIES: hypothetical protein [Sphingobacterium]|jgi:hypothetical protein|uniref:hypothetical protein n=1 Tax=Sphingobacterium TaxID=28453 RepID=UPI00038A0C5C|nr:MULTISPECIES: hypothetical protein [unclassified Sphingobacterium]KKX49334.1 hypothetical protein L950_0216225 [Sphingobacterium sp. IITKGP-BTPF85]NJI72022.1 hypothetical protein [Sphingobacterium sp. B16(2022)]
MKKNAQLIVGFYAGIVTIAFLMLFYSFNTLHQKFDEITVKRINIVDDKGVNRMIISNQERMEPPILFGKKYKRALNPAGIIFYNEKGDECGGLAISKNPETNTYALAFDYDNADAIGILTQQSNKNNHYKSGIVINDKDLSGKIGGNTNRINLMTDNGNSGLVINGPDEKPRIIISVDSLGNPLFKILNNEGKLIKEINSSE